MLVINSINPIRSEINPSPKTSEFYQQFYENTKAQENQRISRHNSKTEDIKFSDYIGKNFSEVPLTPEAKVHILMTAGTTLLTGGDLTVSDAIVLFNLFNVWVSFEVLHEPDIQQFPLATNSNQRLQAYLLAEQQNLPLMVFPYKTSKSQLANWNKENSKIEEATKDLPEFGKEYMPDNVELMQDILQMRENKVTFTKMSDVLMEKYPDDLRLTDPAQISKMHARYSKILDDRMKSVKQMILVQDTKITKSV